VIAIDTSALMAILLKEPAWDALVGVLEREVEIIASAGTIAEAAVVASKHGVRAELERLLERVGVRVVPLDVAGARRVGDAHEAWGKGGSVSALNFGDCFAYALAKERNCPLLYVGTDFPRTDIRSALP